MSLIHTKTLLSYLFNLPTTTTTLTNHNLTNIKIRSRRPSTSSLSSLSIDSTFLNNTLNQNREDDDDDDDDEEDAVTSSAISSTNSSSASDNTTNTEEEK
jgi:hypothetical protein